MRFTDMADELFGTAEGALPAGVRLATAKRGGVTVTRVEIAREGLSRPRGRYVTLEMPSVSVLDERDADIIETCAAELRALLPPEGPVLVLGVGTAFAAPRVRVWAAASSFRTPGCTRRRQTTQGIWTPGCWACRWSQRASLL